MWELAEVFEKRLKYVGNDLDMWEMAEICGKWLEYLTNGLTSRLLWDVHIRRGNDFRLALGHIYTSASFTEFSCFYF